MSFQDVGAALVEDDSPSSTNQQTFATFTPTAVPTTLLPGETGLASATDSSTPHASSSSSDSDSGSGSHAKLYNNANQTTVIIVATLMSVVGCLLIMGALWTIWRCRRRRSRLFTRGVTPIGDDEIETWKGRQTEKELDLQVESPLREPPQERTERKGHQKSDSTTSIRKPPSVIVYARKSDEFSPISPTMPTYPFSKMSLDGGKRSIDKELPFLPIHARAPNAREGLTDEAIPGDEPFIGSPRRKGSRLSKQGRRSHQFHTRHKSSMSSSSLQRPGDRSHGYESEDYWPSRDFHSSHSRAPSTQDPPLLSLSEDWLRGLSQSPILRAEDIGRAIG